MKEIIDYSVGKTPTPASIEGGEKSKDRVRYYFVSDLHLGHKNILKFQPERCKLMGIDPEDPDAIEKHDKWIIDRWKETVRKKDYIYILGDFSFHSTEQTEKILQQLPGHKFLIRGNHDASCRGLEKYFETVSDIKEVIFKKKNPDMDFLDENLRIVMCHFPMITWNCRLRGAVHLHGHVHGSLDDYNETAGELRTDVGFDSRFTSDFGIEVEEIYNWFKKNVADGMPFSKYAEKWSEEHNFMA